MQAVASILARVFGYLCLALSFLVGTETIMRKAFNVSMQGADELGGYALAISSSLAFSVALVGRSHMRIDLLHVRLPGAIQALLNWLAVVSLAVFSGLLSWTTYGILSDSIAYYSTAPTPWATPLVYPQSLWYAGLTIFAVVAVTFALRATVLLARGRFDAINAGFGPKAVKDEAAEEVAAARARTDLALDRPRD